MPVEALVGRERECCPQGESEGAAGARAAGSCTGRGWRIYRSEEGLAQIAAVAAVAGIAVELGPAFAVAAAAYRFAVEQSASARMGFAWQWAKALTRFAVEYWLAVGSFAMAAGQAFVLVH